MANHKLLGYRIMCVWNLILSNDHCDQSTDRSDVQLVDARMRSARNNGDYRCFLRCFDSIVAAKLPLNINVIAQMLTPEVVGHTNVILVSSTVCPVTPVD